MTARQKKALAAFTEDVAVAVAMQVDDRKLEVTRELCGRFMVESRRILAELGAEYD